MSDTIIAALLASLIPAFLGLLVYVVRLAVKLTALTKDIEAIHETLKRHETEDARSASSRGEIRKDIAGLSRTVTEGFQKMAEAQTSYINLVNGMTSELDSRLSRMQGVLEGPRGRGET